MANIPFIDETEKKKYQRKKQIIRVCLLSFALLWTNFLLSNYKKIDKINKKCLFKIIINKNYQRIYLLWLINEKKTDWKPNLRQRVTK